MFTKTAFILKFGVWKSLMTDTFSCLFEFDSCCFNKDFVTSSSLIINNDFRVIVLIKRENLTLNSLLLIFATNFNCFTASSILPLTTNHDTDSGIYLCKKRKGQTK